GSATERDSIVLGDRVGVLAALYGAGTMAYVGGGFGRAGLHSVLEPAAWGMPVVFGPHWRNSRDAGLLLHVGAARALAYERPGPAAQALQDQWQDWIGDEATRETQGARALQMVKAGVGASEQTAELLARFISRQYPRRSRS
ncbi:MAG: 3-deoxy-D-manno-octulosonic acid transferase, partial [Gemmatimonadales bacterium]